MADVSLTVKNEYIKANVNVKESIAPSVSYTSTLTQQYREAVGRAIEVSSASSMDSLLVEENIGRVYKYIGDTTETYTNGQYYIIEEV